MKTIHPALLDDMTVAFLEEGPIRDIVEIEFENAIYEMERDGMHMETDLISTAHDQIVPKVFLSLLLRSHPTYLCREDQKYVLSKDGQSSIQQGTAILLHRLWSSRKCQCPKVLKRIPTRGKSIIERLKSFFSHETELSPQEIDCNPPVDSV